MNSPSLVIWNDTIHLILTMEFCFTELCTQEAGLGETGRLCQTSCHQVFIHLLVLCSRNLMVVIQLIFGASFVIKLWQY